MTLWPTPQPHECQQCGKSHDRCLAHRRHHPDQPCRAWPRSGADVCRVWVMKQGAHEDAHVSQREHVEHLEHLPRSERDDEEDFLEGAQGAQGVHGGTRHVHELRHCYATTALEGGVPLEVVSRAAAIEAAFACSTSTTTAPTVGLVD